MSAERSVGLNQDPVNPEGDDIPHNYTKLNQMHWLNGTERGLWSKPIILNSVSRLLDARMSRAFGLYIGKAIEGVETMKWPEEDASEGKGWSYPDKNERPIEGVTASFSIPFDNPKTHSSLFVYEERFPEQVKPEDRHDWSIGIGRITEYATNYATKEFFRRQASGAATKAASIAYTWFYDLVTYGLIQNGTYGQMQTIETMANYHKINYADAITSALFQHNFDPINRLIAMTNIDGYSGCNNIDDLATKIGKERFKKPDLGKWLDKIDTRREDGKRATSLRNGIISVAGAGVFRNPGVIETSGATLPFMAAVNLIINEAQADSFGMGLINHPDKAGIIDMARYLIPDYFVPLGAEALQIPAAILIPLLPFVLVHESIHYYSSNQDFMGLIPAKIIKKAVTPYKSKLEPAE